MKFSSQQYSQALYHALMSVDAEQRGKQISNFLNLVKNNNDWKLLPQIINDFSEYFKAQQGIIEVTAIAAQETQVAALQEQLEKKLAKQVELTVQIKPEIIGGIILKIGDLLIDGSTRQQLNSLHKKLTNK